MSSSRGRRFVDLCEELHLLSLIPDSTVGPQRGWHWEARVAARLHDRGFPARSVPAGLEVFGVVAGSGLRHQIDGEICCRDALVIAEWKAYQQAVPKNELLRFKAITDELHEGLARHERRRPIYRVFGIAGDASREARAYAARHGIALIERSRWPSPVVADPTRWWPAGDGPSLVDLTHLARLTRPMQEMQQLLTDGSILIPPGPSRPAVDALLALHDRWSDRLSEALEFRDLQPAGRAAA